MLNLNNTNIVADNVITINGVEIARLSDTDAQKIIDICRGFSSTPTASAPSPATKKSKDSKDFPSLGTPDETVGACTRYGSSVRYWEGSFVPEKVKYAIKMSLKTAGAKWDKESGSFKFDKVADAKKFMAEQKKRAK